MKRKNIDHYGINAKEALKSLSLSDNQQRNNARHRKFGHTCCENRGQGYCSYDESCREQKQKI